MDSNQVVIFSAADGREAGRLVHTSNSSSLQVWVSPSTRRILTRLPPNQRPGEASLRGSIQLWEANPWRRAPDPVLDQLAGDHTSRFLTDDLVEVGPVNEDSPGGMTPESLYRIGASNSPTPPGSGDITAELDGELLRYNETELLDGQSLKRLSPPAGRKFHPALKRLASDGRFFLSIIGITDTATEKQIPLPWGDYGQKRKYFPRFGTVGVKRDDGWHVLIFPAPEYLEVSPGLLELWAKVAARGELDDGGAFLKWDERTWRQHQQDLASRPAPYADFPFPGHLAVDPFYWLRQEFENANSADKPRFAEQLLDRANAGGDKVEAARWIAVVASNARSQVDSRFEKLWIKSDVIKSLENDSSLSPKTRAMAIEVANLRIVDWNGLIIQTLPILIRKDAPSDEYRLALHVAEAAVDSAPDNFTFVTALGCAQCRCGKYVESIATLTRSMEHASKSPKAPWTLPAEFTGLSVAHHELGHAAEAKAFRQRLAELD